MQYVLGKPGETVQPDRIDMDEWERFKEIVPMVKEMHAIIEAPPADFLLALARQVQPIVGDRVRDMLGDTFAARQQRQAATGVATAPMQTGSNGDAGPPGEEAWLELERRLRRPARARKGRRGGLLASLHDGVAVANGVHGNSLRGRCAWHGVKDRQAWKLAPR